MKQRIITGVLGGIIFLAMVFMGGLWYSIFILLLALIGLYEFLRMAGFRPLGLPGLLSYLLLLGTIWPFLFSGTFAGVDLSSVLMPILLLMLFYSVLSKNQLHIEHIALLVLGALYIGYGFRYMAATRDIAPGDVGLWLTILVLLGIWSTDSGAYFVGRAMGKRKLWPAISPNKTVEGSIGGLVIALIVVVGINAIIGLLSFGQAAAIAFVTAIAAQIGDLVESAMKRHFGVKDSGRIFPGHGGVLDRFDSFLFVFPILHLLHLL
ncbi:phosphatidate cytidylyltransferase [Brevibacillus sp. B_LB10_24]|uniref:phosphatidate cytidylyltransferase n=1 Tax=Brevibacillus sp. B_LB10_24 TaxID=3380645 RepID=UPI0038BA25EC